MMVDWHHWLAMGGYASFVWSAYGLCLLVLTLLPINERRHRRAIIKAIRSLHASSP